MALSEFFPSTTSTASFVKSLEFNNETITAIGLETGSECILDYSQRNCFASLFESKQFLFLNFIFSFILHFTMHLVSPVANWKHGKTQKKTASRRLNTLPNRGLMGLQKCAEVCSSLFTEFGQDISKEDHIFV